MSHIKLLIYLTLISFCNIVTVMAESLDNRALPLGDGKISTVPMRNYVYSCSTHFHGGGAHRNGDWLSANSWDATHKIHVEGNVSWSNAQFTLQTTTNTRQIIGNGLPTNHGTGIFPIATTDPAYQIDRNPNRIQTQQVMLNLPLSPEIAEVASCLPMGMIAISTGGVAIFNALDDAGRDAVAHEVQDYCNGHPQQSGLYHYHGSSPCHTVEAENNTLIGYALDGFGIYSNRDENGKELTNADLDECHGRTSPVQWDGRTVTMYHYVLTKEYPYTLSCFRGRPPVTSEQKTDVNRPIVRQAPQEAVAACTDKALSSACQFTTLRGDHIIGRCQSPAGLMVCVPHRLR